MTDETVTEGIFAEDYGMVPTEAWPKDWVLDDLVDLFNGEDDNARSALGITVQSNGATITGLLISAGEWIEAMSKTFEESPVPAMKAFPEMWASAVAESAKTRGLRKERDLPVRARSFLHMKDVRVLTGSYYLDLPLWRGTLRDITGWSLGSIDRDE